ncbi:MAG: EipA family protein, partial [Candidatus Binatia bacterium]
YWTGPSIGFDWGGNVSKTFVLVYDLDDVEKIHQRFPGVEGSAYLVGGVGMTYHRAAGITVAPIRVGVGLRLGASVGYLSFSKERSWVPF